VWSQKCRALTHELAVRKEVTLREFGTESADRLSDVVSHANPDSAVLTVIQIWWRLDPLSGCCCGIIKRQRL